MVEYSRFELERSKQLPFRRFFLVCLNLSDGVLYETALIAMSNALGNHPDLLNNDKSYRESVDIYLTQVLVPYVSNVAALQIPLLNWGGILSTEQVCAGFLFEAKKGRSSILPPDSAESVFTQEPRGWNFFLAVVATSAVLCHRNRQVAEYYGVKKSILGKWRWTEPAFEEE